jgi:hypothetical protein
MIIDCIHTQTHIYEDRYKKNTTNYSTVVSSNFTTNFIAFKYYFDMKKQNQYVVENVIIFFYLVRVKIGDLIIKIYFYLNI